MEALARRLAGLDYEAMKSLLDEIPVGIGIAEPVDPDGTIRPDARIVYYNKRWVEMFGFDVGDVETVEQATRRLYPDPELHARMMRTRSAAAGRIRGHGGSEEAEIRAMGADGKWIDVVTGTNVVGDRLVVTMLDISERNRSKRELDDARRTLEKTAYEVTEHMPAGTYTMVQPAGGGIGKFSFVSTRFLELIGLERQAALEDPMNAFACVHPDDYDEWLRKNAYVFEHKLPFSEECRVVVGGETRWIHAESNPRSLPDGSTVWEGVLTDITERKNNETTLATANARMHLASRAAHLGFWHFRVAENREEWDENLYAMYGHTPGSDSPRWEHFLHPDDRGEAEKQLRAALAQGGPYEMEFRIIRPDGAVRHIRECGLVVQDEKGKAVTVTGADIDITERKLAADRERATEQAHRAEIERKLKTSLNAAAVAHEINQPLSAILLESQMALERIKGDTPELVQAREILQSTIARANRVVQTTEKMMSLLRSVKTEHKTIDLVDVVSSATLYAKDELRSQSVALRTRGTERSAEIHGDEGQLVLAVSNLLRNAIEAAALTGEGSGKVFVSLDRRDHEIVLAVGDNGPGLDEKILADTPLNTTKPGGTGLGLFIVQAAAENHDAKLEIGRSELGGAEVRLVFPAAK